MNTYIYIDSRKMVLDKPICRASVERENRLVNSVGRSDWDKLRQ